MMQAAEFGSLRAFVAVAEALSFTRAAARQGVSPSALSQTIRALEDRLGNQLLNRTTRSVSLTEAGLDLLDRVRPAMAQLEGAVHEARRAAGQTAGTIRLHAVRLAARLFVKPMMIHFSHAHPRITVDVTLDDSTLDFVSHGFDAAIRLGEVIEQDMIVVRLGASLRQVAVASPAYLSERGIPETPYDLVRHRCLRWRWPGRDLPYAWEFQTDGRWFSLAVDGPLITNDRAFAVEAALEGLGIAFAAEEEVKLYLAEGRLVSVLSDWCAPFPGFFLCYPRQRHMQPALRAFVDAIRAETSRA